MDKVVKHYDAFSPDTKWNKKRFEDFFGFEPTSDVKNIYCYADILGFDHTYSFSFNCNSKTLIRIVKELDLTQSSEPDNYGDSFQPNFAWWDKKKIEHLRPYKKINEKDYHWYLWYDSIKRKVYYMEFDM